MARRFPVALVLTIVAAGCAIPALTPEQTRVYDEFNACHQAGWSVQLAEVQTNGHFTLTGRHADIVLVRRCLSQRFGYGQWEDPRIIEDAREPGGA